MLYFIFALDSFVIKEVKKCVPRFLGRVSLTSCAAD